MDREYKIKGILEPFFNTEVTEATEFQTSIHFNHGLQDHTDFWHSLSHCLILPLSKVRVRLPHPCHPFNPWLKIHGVGSSPSPESPCEKRIDSVISVSSVLKNSAETAY